MAPVEVIIFNGHGQAVLWQGAAAQRRIYDTNYTVEASGGAHSGTAEEDYGSKFNVSTFELMVDVNTGVLIQYIGYDDNGEISDYIYTENISFENKADKVETFSNNELTGYEEYQKN